jgi:hypothetical protein
MLRRQVLEGGLADIHHHPKNRAGEGEGRFILVGNRRDRVAPDVECLVHGEVARYLLLEASLADRLLVQPKGDGAAGAELALFVDLDLRGELFGADRSPRRMVPGA